MKTGFQCNVNNSSEIENLLVYILNAWRAPCLRFEAARITLRR